MALSKQGEHRGMKRKLIEFTVPGYMFLGPGTNLKRLKYSPAQNKLYQAAKEHDVHYANPNITTEEADEQFLEDAKGTGFVGRLTRAAIRAKKALRLDDYFQGDIDSNQLDSTDSTGHSGTVQNMDGGETSQQNLSERGDSNGWTATVIGQVLPGPSGNFIQQHCFKRTFKNMIKTTDINSVMGTFTKYESKTDSTAYQSLKSVSNYAWAQPELADYFVPYFLTTWVMPPKWEATIRNTMSYRITKQCFKIDNIIAGEWMTKNNKEIFVPNPLTYFRLYINKGNYIGYGNLQGITGVPNKKFTEIQPMRGTNAELP